MAPAPAAGGPESARASARPLQVPGASLRVSVAGCPKARRAGDKLAVRAIQSDDDAARRCGEDAFLIKSSAKHGQICLAILDGVGGWGETPGVDAGRVAHVLMRHLLVQFEQSLEPWASALELVECAFAALQEEGHKDETLVGSTTLCLALMWPKAQSSSSGRLGLWCDVVNVGDSGLLGYRGGRLGLETRKTHVDLGGRVPCQLAVVPPRYKTLGAVESKPSDGSRAGFWLQPGDWLVLASDGVLDNMSAAAVGRTLPKEDVTRHAATDIVKAALRGPKPDDITAIVAQVASIDTGAQLPPPRSKL
eukprot:TRINITY_DN47077_c0_g1_i1.p1 TRINITY_DN47077_c0_g1~~TRINITY_DN47077_c0_g1_i1.p1  ORF type:complete len:307 (+),score=50.33 TRINITY_DN47077_c0_g1_i1:68-988(+)